MTQILSPIGILGGLGALFGVILSLASNAFKVEIDPKVEGIRAVLPGANCGACGFPGCDGLASAIASGNAPITACSVGGPSVAEKVAEVLGVEAEEAERYVATVICHGDCNVSKDKYEYSGLKDCRAQNVLAGGAKACSFGCLGCGTCAEVCDYDAINIVDGIAIIDKEKCTSCKACISICPKHLIELVPYDQKTIVKCHSNEAGKEVRVKCEVGCIGCGICAKNCPVDAIEISNKLASIDYDKCINCGICADKCPTKAIEFNK